MDWKWDGFDGEEDGDWVCETERGTYAITPVTPTRFQVGVKRPGQTGYHRLGDGASLDAAKEIAAADYAANLQD